MNFEYLVFNYFLFLFKYFIYLYNIYIISISIANYSGWVCPADTSTYWRRHTEKNKINKIVQQIFAAWLMDIKHFRTIFNRCVLTKSLNRRCLRVYFLYPSNIVVFFSPVLYQRQIDSILQCDAFNDEIW